MTRWQFKITMRRVLCPLRGHPQFPAHPDGGVVYCGGVPAMNHRLDFACACKQARTHILLPTHPWFAAEPKEPHRSGGEAAKLRELAEKPGEGTGSVIEGQSYFTMAEQRHLANAVLARLPAAGEGT